METLIKSEICTKIPSYEYKREGIIEWFRLGVIKLINSLPTKIAQALFLAFSGGKGDPTMVFHNVTTWKALEILYTYPERRRKKEVNIASVFWQNFLDNARSIRNRLALVKKELAIAIQVSARDNRTVHVLSIGSGSARSVLEAIASFNGDSRNIETMLIDINRTAIDFSKTLAEQLGINYTTRLTGNFFRLERDAVNFHPEVIELVGLLDYLTEKQVVTLLNKSLKLLTPGGFLIGGNIVPNAETPFVTKGINWPMVYRSPGELADLLIEAGFPPQNIKIIQEPLGIHALAVAQKLV